MMRYIQDFFAGTGGAVVKGVSVVGAVSAAAILAPQLVGAAAAFAIGSAITNAAVDIVGSSADKDRRLKDYMEGKFDGVYNRLAEISYTIHFIRDLIIYALLYLAAKDLLPAILKVGGMILAGMIGITILALLVISIALFEDRRTKKLTPN